MRELAPSQYEYEMSEPVPAELEESEPTPTQWAWWRERLRRLRTRARPVVLFVAGVAATFLAILLYQVLFPATPPLTQQDVNESFAHALASVTPAPAFSEQVYQVVRPSLVLIQADATAKDGTQEHDVGSGVIINDQGDILTSLHVVAAATVITLTFADGSESPADVATRQPEQDIAVLHAQKLPDALVPAVLGNPGASRVGDEAFAVGNPFGLYSSMSAGVISGFGRSFQPSGSQYRLEDLIQIDAAVNPGNSGGPLLNRYGEVIGIVTGLVNPTAQNFFVGVGFAVPITMAAPAAGSPPY